MKIFRQLINAILICFLALNFAGCEDILDGNQSHSQQPGAGDPDSDQGGNGEQDGDKLLYSVCNAVDAPIDAPTPFEYK